jgi:hypothetical protein
VVSRAAEVAEAAAGAAAPGSRRGRVAETARRAISSRATAPAPAAATCNDSARARQDDRDLATISCKVTGQPRALGAEHDGEGGVRSVSWRGA